MSDFYSILRKSILDRGIADSGERDAIYAQARRAMIRRLWSFDPPLDEEEIERRIAAFDVAVSDIEADVVAAFGDDDAAETEDDRAEPPPDAYADEAESEPEYYETEEYEEDAREAAYREADDYSVANARRLPVLADPAATYSRQVRQAGLTRYHEDARRVDLEPDDPPYDSDYALEEAEPAEPAARPRSRALARREPPADPYEDEPGYRDEPPPPPRRQRPHQDRWSLDGPRETRNPPQRRPAQAPAQHRRVGPDDDLPRRRQRQRPRQPLSERDKIFMLLGVIGVCVLVLGGIGVYALVPRDGGVTVNIDAQHEVSDAATAVRLAAQAMPVDQTFMLFDGRDPTVFETSPDNPIRFDAAAGTVRISSSTGSAGVRALIGPGLATRLAGHNVRVTIVARSAKDAGAASMRFAYQSGVAISHWQTANLGPSYQAVALTWRVPSMQTDSNGDVLLIQPGVPGDGTGAEVKSIKIDLLAS